MADNYLADLSVMFEIALKMGRTLDLEQEYNRFSELLIHRMGCDYVALWLKEGGQYKLKFANPITRAGKSAVDGRDPIVGRLQEGQPLKADFGEPQFADLLQEKNIVRGSLAVFPFTDPEGFLKVYSSSGLTTKDVKQIETLVKKFQSVVRGCAYYERALQEIELRKAAEEALRRANLEMEKILEENKVMLRKIDILNKELEDKVKERTRELEETVVKLREIAIKDGMTGLYNRQHVLLLGEQAFLDAVNMDKDFSVIMIDVDKFKRVNDTYGHLIGDRVIEILGKRLANSLKNTDLVGRYGGEEFIVFLNCDKAQALEVAERIRHNVADNRFVIKTGVFLPITVSIGVATRRPGDTFDGLIKRADDRLYKAKRAGGNRIGC
ncbi:MAG TPA: diguanylate cyclase [Firmicutes bacterium]|nr:diguanylate cyclase [Bacillota bacterium]